jgi:hypothetical protein
MHLEVVDLTIEHLKKLAVDYLVHASTGPVTLEILEKSYFSAGSVAYCLLSDGEPVFACGIVNLQWSRGEGWILPTPFFKRHVKTCYRIFKKMLPEMALRNHFRRVQAVCAVGFPETLFPHLGFEYEGTLKCFGPFGEQCRMYARIFDDGM